MTQSVQVPSKKVAPWSQAERATLALGLAIVIFVLSSNWWCNLIDASNPGLIGDSFTEMLALLIVLFVLCWLGIEFVGRLRNRKMNTAAVEPKTVDAP
jgi:hypothetical protein